MKVSRKTLMILEDFRCLNFLDIEELHAHLFLQSGFWILRQILFPLRRPSSVPVLSNPICLVFHRRRTFCTVTVSQALM